MATTYKVNGVPATKAEWEQHQFEHFGGPDPNRKKSQWYTKNPEKKLVSPPTVMEKDPKAKFLDGAAFSNINEFTTTIYAGNFAVANRFECLILPPIGGGEMSFNKLAAYKQNARGVSLRCESVSMPGRTLSTTPDTNIYGPEREIAQGVTYAGDVEMLFPASAGLEERVFFEEWQKTAFNEKTWDVGYHEDYVSEIQIYLLDRKNRRTYGIRLHEAYPKTIGAVAFNQAPSSEVIKIPVTFSFRWWETLDINRTGPNPQEKTEYHTDAEAGQINNPQNVPASVNKLNPLLPRGF